MAHTSQCGHELECTTNEMHRDLLTQEREATHALAVLGARVLYQAVEAVHGSIAGVVIESDLLTQDDDSCGYHYANEHIAATVAALTQTGGSET